MRPITPSTLVTTDTGETSLVVGGTPGGTTGTGGQVTGPIAIGRRVPAVTTEKLYNSTGTLKWGGSTVPTGSGTSGKLAKFTGAGTLGDSIAAESGSTITVTGTLTATTALTSGGNTSDSVGTMAAIRAGGIGVASQAQYDMLYASSATQLARVANGTTGQVWTATTSGAPSWTTPVNGPVTLLRSGTGTSTSAGVTTLDSFSVSGLTTKDTIHVYASAGCPTNNIDNLNVYDSTTSTIWGQTGNVAQSQSLKTETMRCKHAGTEQMKTITMSGSGTTLNASTYTNDARDITSTFTLALRWNAIGGGDTGTWTWQVWKVAGA